MAKIEFFINFFIREVHLNIFKYMYVVLILLCSAMPALAMQNNRFLLHALATKTSAVVVDAKTDEVVQAPPKESSDAPAIILHPEEPQEDTDSTPGVPQDPSTAIKSMFWLPPIKPPYRS